MSKSKCTCPTPCDGVNYYCPSNPFYELPMSQNPDWKAYIHKQNLDSYDRKLEALAADLARVEEERREYINRNNLNKE